VQLSIFGILINISNANALLTNLICIIPLTYLFCASLIGLFHLKLSGYYGIYKNQKTQIISLLFLTNFICRIGFPLLLNFLQILKLKLNYNISIALDDVLGETSLVPAIGKKFMVFYPLVLILLCLFNIFDIYGKFLNYLGFSTFDSKDEFNEGKLQEGKRILEDIDKHHKKNKEEDHVEGRYNYYNKDLSSNLIKGETSMTKGDEFIKVDSRSTSIISSK